MTDEQLVFLIVSFGSDKAKERLILRYYDQLYALDSFTLRKGTDAAINYDLSVEYAERFGETIDPNERPEVAADHEKTLAALNEQYEKYMGQYDIHSKDDCHLLYSAADAARNKDYESEEYRKGAERWGADNLAELTETCDQIFWDKIPYEIAHREEVMHGMLYFALYVAAAVIPGSNLFGFVLQFTPTVGMLNVSNWFMEYVFTPYVSYSGYAEGVCIGWQLLAVAATVPLWRHFKRIGIS